MKRIFLASLIVATPAWAQPADPQPQPAQPAQPEPPTQTEPKEPAEPKVDLKLHELEQRLQKVEDELEQAKDDNSYLEEKLQSLLPLTGKISGYVDMGAFVTSGNGAGTRTDLLQTWFPEFIDKVPGSWVFYGDPLSTAINSRGDVADTGESRAVTFDPINSHGKSTMLVNAVNLALFSGIGETAQLNASIDFVPRARDVSDPAGLFVGDYIDVKLAYAEWRPRIEKFDLMLQAGKFDSVVGYEYRSLESPDRVGVTPSLICRYTCGRPTGLKARARFLDEALILNVAVTNGSHFSEGFPFSSETDTNQMKTGAGRLSYQIAKVVEFGVSGAWGAQDFQPFNDVYQWHYGADMHIDWKDLEVTAEYVHGRAKGKTSPMAMAECDVAPCLNYKGAYGLVAYRVTNMFVPYIRVDWRDAYHYSGASFVYIADLARATLGLRAEIGTRVIVKIEGTKNRELEKDVPQIPNDVLTSSLVIKY
ncbi:MAG TPA: outer membrane beta-barrel protein [Kofleriaceae bacterium]|nr:outer membrane beta-barrel protein [Kofleriaceae bacterium]